MPLPLTILCNSLILSNSLDCDRFLALVEPSGVALVVWHEIHEDEREGKAE